MNNRSNDTLLDRHEKAIADILKRFMNMVVAATEPIDEGYTPEKASLNQMQMATETAALIKAIENLLQITREIKRLWITGPLVPTPQTDRENKERDAAIDAKTERICGLFNKWIEKREEDQRAARRLLAERKQQTDGDEDGATANTAASAGPDAASGGAHTAGGPAGVPGAGGANEALGATD
ncbi:uncharacterized protein PG998_011676 [Apiospora kogelbergensis]|uniref:uncharacterized protein n=1 Tax=Apiospora kogelbergensis TaxID=1337665 RepID=UPI00312EA844